MLNTRLPHRAAGKESACTPCPTFSLAPFMSTNSASAAGTGHIAAYDPSSKRVTKLIANGPTSHRGLPPFDTFEPHCLSRAEAISFTFRFPDIGWQGCVEISELRMHVGDVNRQLVRVWMARGCQMSESSLSLSVRLRTTSSALSRCRSVAWQSAYILRFVQKV